jgi:hypothetical protein
LAVFSQLKFRQMRVCPISGQFRVLIRDFVLIFNSRAEADLRLLRQILDGMDQTGNIAGFGEAMIAAF